jgi:hypothetical protein
MHIPLLLAVSALFAAVARADTFWLEPKPATEQPGAVAPDVIHGVLLDETETTLHIRVVGGEVWLAKARVHAVDSDDLTIANVERQEANAKAARRQASRTEAVATEAASPRSARPTAEPAVTDPVAPAPVLDDAELIREAEDMPAPIYDPILHRAIPQGMTREEVMQMLKDAYDRTGDRALIRELRRYRRDR